MSAKRLYRSVNDRKIAGIAAGIAEYFAIDVTLVRLIWVLAVVFGGSGVLAYIIAWIVIPEQPKAEDANDTLENTSETITHQVKPSNKINYLGAFLILLGLYFLIKAFLPWDFSRYFWPLILVSLGVILLIPSRRS